MSLTPEQYRAAALSLKRAFAASMGRPFTNPENLGPAYIEGYHDAIRVLLRLAARRQLPEKVDVPRG